MLELCFYAEKRTSDASDVSFHKWETVCRAFGVHHCYIIDAVGLPFTLRGLETPARIIESFDEVPGVLPRVFVEKDAPLNRTSIPYHTFIHPPDALYCFGKDARGMVDYANPKEETELVGDWIYIPANESLWAEHSAAVILADRYRNADH